MQAAVDHFIPFGASKEPTPDFNIAIIYDDPQAATRAVKICNHLIHEFNDDFLFSIALCDLNSFKEETAKASAAIKAAGRARLVFIVAQDPLPATVWHWLDAWATTMDERPVAIAALNEEHWGTETLTTLQDICDRHSLQRIRRDDVPQAELSPYT